MLKQIGVAVAELLLIVVPAAPAAGLPTTDSIVSKNPMLQDALRDETPVPTPSEMTAPLVNTLTRGVKASGGTTAPQTVSGGIWTTTRASWYQCCAKTASGAAFNPNGLTAAHRTLPFGTRLEVCAGARCVVVTVNDRGPFIAGRTLDLSRGAFARIAPLGQGVATVRYRRA